MLDRPRRPTDRVSRPDDPLSERLRDLCRVLTAAAEAGDEARAVTPAIWERLRASGLLMAPFPVELGGDDVVSGVHHADLFDVLCRLGAADLSVARLVEGHMNAVLLVRRYGTASQVAALAAAIAAGGLSGVWGAEGPVPLSAEPCEGGWRLAGGKILASGAGTVTYPLVPVRVGTEQMLMMPVLQSGERVDLSGWTAQGMRATATGTVDLSGLEVPKEGVVGDPGDFMRQPTFSGGAWRFCAVHLGAAERLVDLMRHHLTSRGRAGDPYQLQRVAEATAAVTTARFWVAAAAQRLGEATATPETVVAFANLTRGVTERACLDVLERVHRGVGLGGFLRPHPIERISRDLATYLRQPVPDLAMADAAKAILASDRDTATLWSATP
ncbi:acyl-CoA/acyl-ACP dehydrogenase [Lichenihabitans sp. Uapishka_5]|uniref:acyl-CoA dehydrogenase family protein n=1 Tax=Lichenihabitans sp. Uapishka_5 TaxID=3037302 RepID=UPI0029E7DA5D|nr:acyl-CoA dehydrogenase family protein [Lichenihabitans sp. Uapishka_5]MDX7951687.1 acyl-CoA/acyl-ACP dehydrogenase [Lichenihabitans sp. Uapishka_5]